MPSARSDESARIRLWRHFQRHNAVSQIAQHLEAMPVIAEHPSRLANNQSAAFVQDVGWRCGPGLHMNRWRRSVSNRGPGWGWRRPGWRRGWRRC